MKQNIEFHVVFWAFVLHTLWEFIQCLFLYSMWDWPFWEATLWMWAAIFGDILIVLVLWKIAAVFVSTIHFQTTRFKGYAILISISFVASIFLEWLARAMNLWQYSSYMPVIEILNHHVGFSPVLQITFLPALSVYLARKSKLLLNRNTK
ncbi:hypothetical protein ACKGJO_08875 [Gracilimonas sp. Q87]|uniref:hypothetical protein n=1 Tax=Gracilimonas sp. Q87 TaxID=3384766 RepID=UPI003983F1AE